MKMRCLVAALAALASVCGLAQDFNVMFKVSGLPSLISTNVLVPQGDSFSYAFDMPDGYRFTKISVLRGKPAIQEKLIAVSVGVNQYADGTELTCFLYNATYMQQAFHSIGASGSSNRTVTGTEATKEGIQKKIADAAEALKSGDFFVLYLSAIGDPGTIYTYDEPYAANELADDLSAFAEGVKIYVIIDANFAGSFAEHLEGKATYMLACKENQHALVLPSFGKSLFTLSMNYGGRSAWADTNNDGLITVEEMANGTLGYLKALNVKKQTPVCGVKSPADMATVISTTLSFDTQGYFFYNQYDENEKAYVSGIDIPDVQMNYNVTVTAAKEESALGNILEVQKYGVSYKLATEGLEAGLPMKASIAAAFHPDVYGLYASEEISGPCFLNGYGAGNFLLNIVKCKGQSLDYVMVNRDWLPCGKLSIKGNAKKGVISFKSSIKDVDNSLYNAFDTNLPEFPGNFMMRIKGMLLTGEGPMAAKFKEGKSYSAKLAK